MSRYELTPINPTHIVSVGWDNPLQTFFAHVRPVDQDDDEQDDILWVGTAPGEIKRVDDLLLAVAPYAILSKDVVDRLQADRVQALDRGPTGLQRSNLKLVGGS